MEVGSKRLDDASDDSRNVSRPKRRIHGGKSSRDPHIDPIPLSILISYTCLNCHTFNHVGSVIIFMLVQREEGGGGAGDGASCCCALSPSSSQPKLSQPVMKPGNASAIDQRPPPAFLAHSSGSRWRRPGPNVPPAGSSLIRSCFTRAGLEEMSGGRRRRKDNAAVWRCSHGDGGDGTAETGGLGRYTTGVRHNQAPPEVAKWRFYHLT